MNKDIVQQVLNNAWERHVVRGEGLGWDGSGRVCRYRTEDGRACAIGASISDELYSSSLEGAGVSASLKLINVLEMSLGVGSIDFMTTDALSDLQKLHDRVAMAPHADKFPLIDRTYYASFEPDIPKIEQVYRHFAEHYELEIPNA